MGPRIEYKSSVAKDLEKLGRPAALRLLRKLEETLAQPDLRAAPLTGEFAGLYRIRVGDYRVIYACTLRGYLVLRIGHRREIYRRGRP